MDGAHLEKHLQTAFPECGCLEVLTTGQPRIIQPREGCTIWGASTPEGRSLCCHGTVPVLAGEKVLGVLSVASTDSEGFESGTFTLLEAVGRQIGIVLDNAHLWAELQDKERLRSELLARAIHAQEDERRRIARELHDETGQAMNAMVFGLKAAETALENDPGHAQEVIARLKAAASDNVRELQGIIYDLRPSVLDDLGLIPALRWFAESRLEPAGIEVQWEISGAERRLEPEVETALFRIGQEAMTNALRHAEPHRVRLCLDFSPRSVTLCVSDDGEGFEVESVLAHRDESGRGLGLLGMRERVELLGGSFAVESAPGAGAKVQAQVPLIGSEAKR
jgi:signal transduction histidine kinase